MTVPVPNQARALEAPMNRVFIALGSNIDGERNLREAVRRLALSCRLLAVSPVYETAPVGKTDQPNFLNAAALVETDLTARENSRPRSCSASSANWAVCVLPTKTRRARLTWTLPCSATRFSRLGPRHIPDPDLLRYAHIAVPMADLAPRFATRRPDRPC